MKGMNEGHERRALESLNDMAVAGVLFYLGR